MLITLVYMTKAKKIIGKPREVINLEKSVTVQEFIVDNLCQRYTNLRSYILGNDGKLNKTIAIFINNKKLEVDVPTHLSDGDEITIMTPIAGG